MHLFTAARWTGELITCDEGDLEWIDSDHLLALPLWEGDKIFLRLLRDGAEGFDLTLNYEGERLAAAALERLGSRIPRTMKHQSAAVEYIPGDTFPY